MCCHRAGRSSLCGRFFSEWMKLDQLAREQDIQHSCRRRHIQSRSCYRRLGYQWESKKKKEKKRKINEMCCTILKSEPGSNEKWNCWSDWVDDLNRQLIREWSSAYRSRRSSYSGSRESLWAGITLVEFVDLFLSFFLCLLFPAAPHCIVMEWTNPLWEEKIRKKK